jgi:hypothetical protein
MSEKNKEKDHRISQRGIQMTSIDDVVDRLNSQLIIKSKINEYGHVGRVVLMKEQAEHILTEFKEVVIAEFKNGRHAASVRQVARMRADLMADYKFIGEILNEHSGKFQIDQARGLQMLKDLHSEMEKRLSK